MRFTSRHMLSLYLSQQPQRMRNRMHTVVTKVWNPTSQEWVEVFDVILTNAKPPKKRQGRKKTRKDFSKKTGKQSQTWVP